MGYIYYMRYKSLSYDKRRLVVSMYDYEKEHLQRVRKGLAECMVLLKSDGTSFPLTKPCEVAAYGNGVRHSVKGGTGSGEVNSRYSVNFEQGLKDAGFTITTDSWLNAYDDVVVNAKKQFIVDLKRRAKESGANIFSFAMGAIMPEPEYDLPLDGKGEAAIYVLSRISGEGNDRKPESGDVCLTKSEIRDINKLCKEYDKFLLVINAGGPVDLTPVSDVKNVLVASQLGVEMGNALADVLLGNENPSGKLATTWACWEDYCPDVEIGKPGDNQYKEGVYVGYRYFDTVNKKAMFPFGFGLSYTTFSLEPQNISIDGTEVTVVTKVTNTGNVLGKEVVQVYVTTPEKKLKKPYQDLAGFVKTKELKPSESEDVKVCFDLADLASFDEDITSYVLEEGEYIVRVGSSSVDTVAFAKILLDGDVITRKCRAIIAKANVDEVIYNRVKREENLDGVRVINVSKDAFTTIETVYDTEPEVLPEVKNLTDEELVSLMVGNFSKKGGIMSVIGNAAKHVVGAAGESTSLLESKGIKPIIMADGPAGLRLAKQYYEGKDGLLHPVGGGSLPESMLDMMPWGAKLMFKLLGSKKLPKGTVIKDQYCTAIPIGTAIAQSFNVEYAKECGDIVGEEMERFGVHLWLAPALNIHRSILCGRNFEYYSEDPLISGKFAAAITNGVQAHPGCGTTIKHYCCNNQEYNRYFMNSIMSERTLREIYLRGFDICVRESQPHAIMTSYNLLNGTHTAETRGLSEDHLRSEVGFKGIIMTDWVIAMMQSLGGPYRNSLANNVVKAGGDIFMPGSQKDCDDILNDLKAGTLARHQLEVNATRLINMSRLLVK